MAKNVYRKYAVIEQKEVQDVFRDKNYDFQNDPNYTTNEKKLLKRLQDGLASNMRDSFSGHHGKYVTSFEANLKTKQYVIKSIRNIEKEKTYNENWYIDLNNCEIWSGNSTALQYIYNADYWKRANTLIQFYVKRTPYNPDNRTMEEWQGIRHIEEVVINISRGAYIGEVEAEEGTYPLEQNYNGYWYEYDRPANYAPQISGSDYDMGSQTENFDIEYYVSDQNDESIDIKILLDDIQKETKSVFNNQKNTYTVDIKNLNLGSHTVKIIATDSFGATDTRTYTFYKSNVAPKISGQDKDLGGKSLGFTITYDITDSDGDEVDVTISLNNEELSNITTNSKNGLTFTLSDDKVKALTIGDIYTITIKVDDRKGGIAYRRFTFTKTNSVPVISGSDKDLGEKSETFSHTFSVTDYEKDPISFRVKLDGKVIKEVEQAEDGTEYTADVSYDDFIRLSYGEHKITIEAWDSINQEKVQVRELTFTRVSSGLDVEIKLATSSVQPKKIIAVPHGIFAPDATLQVLVCNNYLDSSPTWEDATEMSNIARAYAFENTVKEGDEWAIGIKIVVENGESGEISILKGVKGGFE